MKHLLLISWACLTLACEAAPLRTAEVRLGLDTLALPAADLVVLRVLTPEGEESRHTFTPPWPGEVLLDISPGTGRAVELSASVASVPYAVGRADLPLIEAGSEVEAEVVVDLVGVLEVAPLGLAEVLGIIADPQTPYEGQPRLVPLQATGDRFTAVLPAGRYDLQFRLADAFLDWIPAASPEVLVVPGVVRTWTEPLAAPDVPLPEPGVAVRLELEVAGGTLLGGLLPVAADLHIRALDAEGRLAIGYRGEVTVRSDGLVGLVAALLPPPYRFTEADGGQHTFPSGLQAPVTLVARLLRLVASDDTGLQGQLDVRVVPP